MNVNKQLTALLVGSLILAGAVGLADSSSAARMTSESYSVIRSSLNRRGPDRVSSARFRNQESRGQMISGSIAITASPQASFADLAGLKANAVETTPAWRVITDSPAGYELSVRARTSPTLQHVTADGSFADHDAGTEPDYHVSVPASGSAFGFTPEGENVAGEYLDNGKSCGVGKRKVSRTCWRGFTTSSEVIAHADDSNQPTGATTTLRMRAETGADAVQTAGQYSGTIVITGVAI